MAGKRRNRKKRKQCRHPCECGWRVRWTASARLGARSLGIWESVKAELKDLEKRLRDDRLRDEALERLLSEPVVADVYVKRLRRSFPARRYYFGKATARGFYVVRTDICRVWFVAVLPRTDSTYKRKKVKT